MEIHIREPFNAISHFLAAIAALIGTFYLLIFNWGHPKIWSAFLVYGISVILLFTSSALYHYSNVDDKKLIKLRKLDHSAIYLLIAGSYTPICVYFFSGFWQWGLLAIIWSLAIIGIVVKLFIIQAPRWVTAGVYLIMGWLCVIGFNEILTRMPLGAIIWLAVGGLFYTLGAIIYITKRINIIPGVLGFHEIWHIFVILGALSHFILMIRFINP
ncbi:MAG: PAQR family membrane homeostasis protein TrhA [Anaerolineaceae bacterium]